MATKSILKNVRIDTRAKADKLLRALEKSSAVKEVQVDSQKQCRTVKIQELKQIFGDKLS